jgi:hypothetical protein
MLLQLLCLWAFFKRRHHTFLEQMLLVRWPSGRGRRNMWVTMQLDVTVQRITSPALSLNGETSHPVANGTCKMICPYCVRAQRTVSFCRHRLVPNWAILRPTLLAPWSRVLQESKYFVQSESSLWCLIEPAPVPNLSQINPVLVIPSYFRKIHFNIVLTSTSKSS